MNGSDAMRGATTRPESIATGLSRRGRELAVRWAFPVARTTRIPAEGIIGRDADCAIALAGRDVSRRHALLRKTGLVACVRDLDSRNGTWVNGVRVSERVLGPNDVLRVGEWIGLVTEVPLPDDVAGGGAFTEIAAGWYGGATLAAAVGAARRAAVTDLPIIVEGETGSGKEGVARAVHAWSGRRGPFVAVNAAAIPAAMAEGEMFGYGKGAFTGAERANPGYFRAAHGGTLFLDEVVEMPLAVQAKLLRVLELGEVQPLGEPRATKIDVRVVCAAQEPLAVAAGERRFRADLLARLDGLTVKVPPLRERREDIAPLFLQLLATHTRGRAPDVDSKLVEALLLYDWPLNVRELVLLTRRLLAMHASEPTLKRAMLPERMLAHGVAASSSRSSVAAPSAPARTASAPPARQSTTDEAALQQLLDALRAHQGNVTRAAAAIGISRARAYRLLEANAEADRRSHRVAGDGDDGRAS